MNVSRLQLFAAVLLVCVPAFALRADTFGTGEYQFTIDFVTIGDPGNAADTTGDPNPAGSVGYTYRMGKYEVPEHAIRYANAATALTANPLNITLDERGPDKPATRASWFEAARFVNYLNEDKGAPAAYKFDTNGEFQLWEPGDAGYDPANPFRNSLAHYFLPSADEWYKAAFYDPATDQWFDYPNGMDTAPLPVASGTEANTAVYSQAGPADVMLAGGASPFGTVGQAGNVWEWLEQPLSADLQLRAIRGDEWGSASNPIGMSSLGGSSERLADFPGSPLGFRVATIPEPSSFVILILSLFLLVTPNIRT